jgi:serine/threonine-protein kinase
MARRFLREMRLARRITHPNVCRLHEYGESEGIRYLCMELVDGVNLKDVLRSRRLRTEEAYDVALAASEGLAAVHAQGVIHRDFKTANIMLDARGQAKVMDFGIAKEAGADTTGLSLAGHVLGTPEYMSPEHAQGGTVDFRSDLYALGCVIFEIFAGRALFQGTSPIDTLRRHLTQPAEFSGGGRGLLIPEALVPVLTRALAKKPEQRQQSVSDLVDEMRAAREGAPLHSVLDDDVFVAPPPSVRPSPPDPSAPLTPGATRALSGPHGRTTAPGAKRRGSRALVVGLSASVLVALVVVVWQRSAPPPAVQPQTVGTASAPPTVITTLPAPPSTSLAAAPTPTPAPSPTPRGDRSRSPQRAEVRASPPPITQVAAVTEPTLRLASAPAPPPSTQPVVPSTTLAQATGVLTVTVLPPSEVFIDATSHGVMAAGDIRLPAGKHDIEVRNVGYKPYRRVVVVVEGVRAPFSVDLAVQGVALSEKGERKNP